MSPEVSELLMEAQLLQVALPEIQELYRTLLAKPGPALPAGRSPGRPTSEKVRGRGRAGPLSFDGRLAVWPPAAWRLSCIRSPPQGECCRVKREGSGSLDRTPKRRPERDGLARERWGRLRRVWAPGRKRLRLGPPPDPGTFPPEGARGFTVALRPADTHSLPSDTSSSEQEDSEDEDAICPAGSCLQPEGDEVSAAWPRGRASP